MASASCPNCQIILVEANGDNSDIYAAEDEAASLGVSVISDSWGEPEYSARRPTAAISTTPASPIVAAGDSGFGVTFPAACASVTAVGGTTLYQDTSKRGWGESAWSGIGVAAPGRAARPTSPSPPGSTTGCAARARRRTCRRSPTRTPRWPSTTPTAVRGWVAVGGTSAAAPLIAGVYALAGNAATIGPGASLYAHHRALYDVTSGSNATPGNSCGGSYLCTARTGYDGPTGWGTPHGIGAF